MVYVQTMEKVSCTIHGDSITREGDFYIVRCGGKTTGVFDVGVVKFMYLTTPRERKGEANG